MNKQHLTEIYKMKKLGKSVTTVENLYLKFLNINIFCWFFSQNIPQLNAFPIPATQPVIQQTLPGFPATVVGGIPGGYTPLGDGSGLTSPVTPSASSNADLLSDLAGFGGLNLNPGNSASNTSIGSNNTSLLMDGFDAGNFTHNF